MRRNEHNILYVNHSVCHIDHRFCVCADKQIFERRALAVGRPEYGLCVSVFIGIPFGRLHRHVDEREVSDRTAAEAVEHTVFSEFQIGNGVPSAVEYPDKALRGI